MWKDDFIDLLFPTDPQKMKIEEAMILKSDNIPKSLFKYKSFDESGHSLKMLEDDLIWLSSPEKFNDPYDCALTYAAKKIGNFTFQRDIISFLERLPAEYKFNEEEEALGTVLFASSNFHLERTISALVERKNTISSKI